MHLCIGSKLSPTVSGEGPRKLDFVLLCFATVKCAVDDFDIPILVVDLALHVTESQRIIQLVLDPLQYPEKVRASLISSFFVSPLSKRVKRLLADKSLHVTESQRIIQLVLDPRREAHLEGLVRKEALDTLR
jgi:hypothetical protein